MPLDSRLTAAHRRGQPGLAGTLVVAFLASVLVLAGRAAAEPSPGALPPVLTLRLDATAMPGVPSDAVGLALNVTVTEPAAAGYLTVYPCASGRPLASNLNYVARQTVPNFVVTAIDPYGGVCIDSMATTDVVVDLAGYVPVGSPLTMLRAPVRFADTRVPGDVAGIRLRAGEIRAVRVAGVAGVPPDASAVVFNATAVTPDRDGFLSVFPCGRPIPATSTLNFVRGTVVPNLVTSSIGPDGTICFVAIADLDLVADVAAYVPAGASGMALLPAPERILDTRVGLGGPTGRLGPSPRAVQVTGVGGVPSGATAAIVNLTATEGTAAGYVSAYPCGGSPPLVSSLNFGVAQSIANAAFVKLAPDGTLCLRSNVPVHGIVDISGYLSSADALVPVDPVRVADTREEAAPLCDLGVVQVGTGWQWYDLATGAPGAVFRSPQILQGTSFVDISPDCGTAVVVVDRVVYVVDRAGAVVSSSPMPAGVFSRLMFLSDVGPLAVAWNRSPSAAMTLVDALTGDSLFDFVALDRNLGWDFAGAARDLSVFMFFTRLADSTKEFHVLDVDGVEVATFRLPAGADGFQVSPSGLYMAFSVRSPGPSGEVWSGTQVVTTAGDPVDVHPASVAPYIDWAVSRWVSDGRAITCDPTRPNSSTYVLVRSNLFSPSVRTNIPCPTAAL